jgi:hypothetical protein
MNKDNKKPIVEVYNALCHRDPSWRNPKMYPKFKTLFDAWRTVELRHKIHSHLFYTISWKRGWLPKADFERFSEYAMQ